MLSGMHQAHQLYGRYSNYYIIQFLLFSLSPCHAMNSSSPHAGFWIFYITCFFDIVCDTPVFQLAPKIKQNMLCFYFKTGMANADIYVGLYLSQSSELKK